MDVNCDDIRDGVTIEDRGYEIFQIGLGTVLGEHSKLELLAYGFNEFVAWQIGTTS